MHTLDELPIGQLGLIVDCGNDAIAMRLMELGLFVGEQVKRTGQTPWGDPLEYTVNGVRMSLRRNEASRIQIELID
jgi:ferrous iron transport protein A